MTQKIIPNQREIVMRDDAFIVTKTDNAGIITYANRVFIEYSGFTESELLGTQHSVVRHPDMPRAVFDLLWNTVKAGDEFFGYVKNLRKDGSFYWAYVTITPSYAADTGMKSEIIGYFSVRRRPHQAKLAVIQDLYRDMLIAEKRADELGSIAAGTEVLNQALQATGKSYHEFILTL